MPPTSVQPPFDRARRLRRPGLLLLLAYALTWLLNRSLRRVEGPSMLPSLWPGDLLVTVPTRLVAPRTGDVVVARQDGHRVTKRLAAPSAREITLHDGHLLTDGTWWRTPDAVLVDEELTLPVPAGQVVLLGDHRARSTDSRQAGPVPTAAVERVALVRLWPLAWLRGRAARLPGARPRPGVRMVVLDPDDRVLLFRVADVDGSAATWWEAPGGGRHPGEPAAAAAARELAEEVGATAAQPVPLGETHERHASLLGAELHKVEDVFAVRLEGASVDDRGWTPAEVRDIVEVRWWTPGELARLSPGEVVPGDLVRLVEDATGRV